MSGLENTFPSLMARRKTIPSAKIRLAATNINTAMSLEKIFSEVFGLPESSVVDSLALSDIPTWDSLVHMMLIVRLEETYQIQFTGDEIADIKSIGDIRSLLLAHGAVLC